MHVWGARSSPLRNRRRRRRANLIRSGRRRTCRKNDRRRRAAAYGTRATNLTSPLGVSDYGSASRPGVTLLGRA
ncbi:hypothetical protein QW131_15355 [Roseibium salinum]|nr:hypothetical protein [Roseibium salinum]